MIHPSLLPVAVVGFFMKLAIFVTGPLVGKLMDHFPRVQAYNCLTTIQAAAQLLSVAMIIRAHTVTSIPAASVLLKPWFCVLVLAGAVERLSGLALGVAMERDWMHLTSCVAQYVNVMDTLSRLSHDTDSEVAMNIHQGFVDEALVRFLKARDWNVAKERKMLVDCLNWRITTKLTVY